MLKELLEILGDKYELKLRYEKKNDRYVINVRDIKEWNVTELYIFRDTESLITSVFPNSIGLKLINRVKDCISYLEECKEEQMNGGFDIR